MDKVTSAMRIELTQGLFAFVDKDDYEPVTEQVLKWHTHHGNLTWYARGPLRRDPSRKVLLHRLVLGVTDPSMIVDHINGLGFDCTRSNLRIASAAQNRRNIHQPTFRARVGVRRSEGRGWHWLDRRTQEWSGPVRSELHAAVLHDRASYEIGMLDLCNLPIDIIASGL